MVFLELIRTSWAYGYSRPDHILSFFPSQPVIQPWSDVFTSPPGTRRDCTGLLQKESHVKPNLWTSEESKMTENDS